MSKENQSKKNGYGKNVYKSLAMVTQFGINMIVPIFLCSFLGMYLDKKFSTSYWFVLLFFVGAVAGARNVFVFAKRLYEGPSDKEKNRNKRKESLQKETNS